MKVPLRYYLRLYFAGSWYSFRALFYWMKPFPYFSSKVVFPLFQMILFIFIARYAGVENDLYIVIGNILFLSIANNLYGVTMTVNGERQFRTLPYLLGSPAPRVPLFLGRALFNIIDGMLNVIAGLAIAALFFGLDMSQANPLLIILCVFITSLAGSGIGLILGSISLLTREAWMIASIVTYVMFFFCGINFPIEILPSPLQLVSLSLPMTRGIVATREALIGTEWAIIAPLLRDEILIGAVYTFVGYMIFQRIEKWSLLTGQLETV